MTVVAIPAILREKLTDKGAEALVDLINEADKKDTEGVITLVEEKFERRLAEEIGKVRSELIKWMFIFIFGQFWAIVGVLFVFFKK